jgi:hypothetical protein
MAMTSIRMKPCVIFPYILFLEGQTAAMHLQIAAISIGSGGRVGGAE